MRSRRAKNNVVLNALLVTIMDVATTTATTNLTDVGETHHARAPLRGDLIARGTTGFLGFLGDTLAHAVVMDTQGTMVIVNVNSKGSATDATEIGTVGLQTASLNMTPNLQPTGSEIVSTLQQVCGLSAYSDTAAPILTLVL